MLDEGDDLFYIRARYYDSEQQRFVGKDAKAGNDREGQSLNRYVYGLNNPVRLIDISGFLPSETIDNTNNNKDKSSDTSPFNNYLVEALNSRMLTANVLQASTDASSRKNQTAAVILTKQEGSTSERNWSKKKWLA